MKKKYVIFDGKATENTDHSMVMSICDTLEEAIELAPDYGGGCCIWSFNDVLDNDGKKGHLENGKLERIMPTND